MLADQETEAYRNGWRAHGISRGASDNPYNINTENKSFGLWIEGLMAREAQTKGSAMSMAVQTVSPTWNVTGLHESRAVVAPVGGKDA